MDLIREHLIYKDVPVQICMGKLKSQEHYEIIRLLLATRKNNVTVCLHGLQNIQILSLLSDIQIPTIPDCSVLSRPRPSSFQ